MIRRIGIFLFPGFSTIDLSVMTVFELANRQSGRPVYELTILSDRDGVVTSAAGAMVQARAYSEADGPYDTVMVFGTERPLPEVVDVIGILRGAGAAARRTATVCAGMALMARTGLLDGHRVTTHWSRSCDLQAAYPSLKVDADHIHVRDGKHWSSAGMAASIDLALALIETDLGVDTALAVARMLVVYHWRSGFHTQISAMLAIAPKSDRIQGALSYARQNLRQPLTVDTLADQVGMSRRHFTRTFRTQTGHTPARAIEVLRVEAASVMLQSAALSLDSIARETGFSSSEQMRLAFVRVHGQTPQALRHEARAA
jgi:transcriptional regulator GlxA family with amidase domain